jgi:hypothetical protein
LSYFVTDKIGHTMTLDTSERLRIIEPNTYEECFLFEDEPIFCYKKGNYNDCQAFIDKQTKDIQECLEIKEINNI